MPQFSSWLCACVYIDTATISHSPLQAWSQNGRHTVNRPSPVPLRTSTREAVMALVKRFSFESSFWSSYELARIDVRAAGGRGDQCPCHDDDHDQGQNQEHNQPSLNTVDVNSNIKDKVQGSRIASPRQVGQITATANSKRAAGDWAENPAVTVRASAP